MKSFVSIVLIVFIQCVQVIANEIKENCEKVIREYFVEDIEYSFYEFEVPVDLKAEIERECSQRFFNDRFVVWEILKNDTVHALGLLDNVYGKSLPITFMTLFDKSGFILKSEIIKYRETYGGGVANELWMSQFNGYNDSSSYIVGEDIQIISGATISSYSVTRGIRKLSLIVKHILSRYENRTSSSR